MLARPSSRVSLGVGAGQLLDVRNEATFLVTADSENMRVAARLLGMDWRTVRKLVGLNGAHHG